VAMEVMGDCYELKQMRRVAQSNDRLSQTCVFIEDKVT
jgi:hypothetical protein